MADADLTPAERRTLAREIADDLMLNIEALRHATEPLLREDVYKIVEARLDEWIGVMADDLAHTKAERDADFDRRYLHPKPKRRAPEQALQKQIAQFLDAALTGNAWYSTIPLGGGGRVRGAILRGMGVKAGVPDMMILDGGRPVFLELKAPKGRLSVDQIVCHQALRRARCAVYVIRSLDEAIIALRECGVPMRIAETV